MLQAIVDVWRLDLKYRMSRAKARLKFMVARPRAPRPSAPGSRSGWDGGWRTAPVPPRSRGGEGPHRHPSPEAGGALLRRLPGPPGTDERRDHAPPGRSGRELGRRDPPHPAAELHPGPHPRGAAGRGRAGGRGARLSRWTASGLRGRQHRLHRRSRSATTPWPRPRGGCRRSSSTWRRPSATAVSGLRLNLDGCPHACAHHWIGDIGLQGTTLRERGPAGERIQGYDLFLRGGLGPRRRHRPAGPQAGAGHARSISSSSDCSAPILEERRRGERIQQFFTRHSDEELVALGAGEAVAVES